MLNQVPAQPPLEMAALDKWRTSPQYIHPPCAAVQEESSSHIKTISSKLVCAIKQVSVALVFMIRSRE